MADWSHLETTLGRITGVNVKVAPQVPGIPAPSQRPWGLWDDVTGTIWLTTRMADRIQRDIRHEYAQTEMRRTNRGIAWKTLGHEYAHSQGYDHGETGIGAECASFRLYMRPFMHQAGLEHAYIDRVMKAVKKTGPCIKWRAAATNSGGG